MECSGCGAEKDPGDFPWKDKNTGKRRKRCKRCVLDFQKAHYAGSPRRKAKVLQCNLVLLERNRAWIIAHLRANPCIDCGEDDIRVLEFDHRDNKILAVSLLVARKCSIKKIAAEAAKCDIRCANCHKKRTNAQLSWYRNKEFDR